MPALDTIASFQTTVASTLAAGVMATGDSNVVRNFPDSAKAQLIELFYDDVTSPQAARIRSALFHDNVRGIQVTPGATAPAKILPSYGFQELKAQDALTFELSTAAATGRALLAAAIYYSQLPGAASRLYMPGDVLGLIANIKPVYVAIGSGANTAGQWYDLVMTTTENLLKANTDYAVLGIEFDQAVAAVAVKGADTGNLRCAVPGGVNNPYAADYFVRKSYETGLPLIPVINAANAGSTFVSLISSAATGAAGTAQLILAQLSQNLG
jgi:hypothetical protein